MEVKEYKIRVKEWLTNKLCCMLRCELDGHLWDSGSHGGKYEVYSVFCDIAPCSQVEVDRRFRGAYCLHHSSPCWWWKYTLLKRRSTSTWLHGATSQKTLNFIDGHLSRSSHFNFLSYWFMIGLSYNNLILLLNCD
jgi:hypothetical protein